jgi:hypothetical protein
MKFYSLLLVFAHLKYIFRQNIKIKDLQHQVLSLVERNQQLEKKQFVLARQQIAQQRDATGSEAGGDSYGSSSSSSSSSSSMATMRRQMEELLTEQKNLSSMLREEKRKNKRIEQALMVEREMNMESQRIIESLHHDGDGGHTSTSS